jgi:hypothetical protein
MNQPYLEIARSLTSGTAALSPQIDTGDTSLHGPFAIASDNLACLISLEDYRQDGVVRRCSGCGRLPKVSVAGYVCVPCSSAQIAQAPERARV